MRQEVLLVGEQTTEQHGIEAVHCLTEEANKEGEEEQHSSRVGERDWLLQQRLIVSFAALNGLDFDNLSSQLLFIYMAEGDLHLWLCR